MSVSSSSGADSVSSVPVHTEPTRTAVVSATSHSAVSVSNLTKSYGGRTILGGLDLNIAVGETYALLGPNGAGKSTAIEILEGLRRPSGGEVRVLGIDPLLATRSWRARIGIVSQNTGDFGPYSPKELLQRFASLYPRPRSVAETLALVGLTEQAAQRATKLSGGQQRRLDVALGVIGRPEVLFLDEPTTGFDPEARRQFWSMLTGLSADGTAIVLTTHYLDEAAHLADRVGVLIGGRIVAEAPPAELGGADARVPIVRWRDELGTVHEHRTTTPGALVQTLTARTPRGEPAELEIRRPSLEDVYLELIEAHSATGSSPTQVSVSQRVEPATTQSPTTSAVPATTQGQSS